MVDNEVESRINNSRISPVSQTIVLNSLRGILIDENQSILDSNSKEILMNHYYSVTTESERTEFLSELSKLADGSKTDSELVLKVTDTVIRRMDSSDISAQIVHSTRATIPKWDANLCSYICCPSVSKLEELNFSPEVHATVITAAEKIRESKYGEAANLFEEAITLSQGNDMVWTRILAAWAYFWDDQPDLSLNIVEEALHLHLYSPAANIVRRMADEENREGLRLGELKVRPILRWLTNSPSDEQLILGSVQHTTGPREKLESQTGLLLLDHLTPELDIQFQIKSPVAQIPTLDAYYLGVGFVNPDQFSVETVEYIFHDGPETAPSTESIEFLPGSGSNI